MNHIFINKLISDGIAHYEVKAVNRDKVTFHEGYYDNITMAKIHVMNICQAYIISGIDFTYIVTCVDK